MSAAAWTSTFETFWPASPVCLVTRGCLNMTSATEATSSRDLMNLTPPKSLPLSLKRPLPRPPAWTWALRTTGPPPSWSNARCASAGVDATMPRGMAAPAPASTSFAWYSWIFIVLPREAGTPLSLYRPGAARKALLPLPLHDHQRPVVRRQRDAAPDRPGVTAGRTGEPHLGKQRAQHDLHLVQG